MIEKLFVRNVKKGFATNSSSYHSTITHYVTLPSEIWIGFKEGCEIEDNSKEGYIQTYTLVDDEDYIWASFSQLEKFEYDVHDLKDGKIQIAIKVPDEGDDWNSQRDHLVRRYE